MLSKTLQEVFDVAINRSNGRGRMLLSYSTIIFHNASTLPLLSVWQNKKLNTSLKDTIDVRTYVRVMKSMCVSSVQHQKLKIARKIPSCDIG